VTEFGVNDLAEFTARMAELRSYLSPPTAAGHFVAYTDGACFGNPRGNGGWAAAFIQPHGWQLFGHLSSTSNNRAEALGVLATLEWVPPHSTLTIHADSELTVNQLNGLYKVKKNADVWEVIKRTCRERELGVKAEWVRGHAGDPMNELADRLSKLGALNATLDDMPVLETPPPSELDGITPRGDWETSFLSSVRDQLRRGRQLSDKQRAVVERMRARGS
jgi:ribonuclease HI